MAMVRFPLKVLSTLFELLLQSVRVYFGCYHCLRIILAVWGLLLVHSIGHVGILNSVNWIKLFLFRGRWGRRLTKLHRELRRAPNYDSWARISGEIDNLNRVSYMLDSDDDCDVRGLATHVDALWHARTNGNWEELAFLLRLSCQRNFCHLRNPALYAHSLVRTKSIVHKFYMETCSSIIALVDVSGLSDELLFEELRSMRLALGRTAFCLSGGGGLAIYHMGVLKTLIEHKMLPKIISGSSGGSLIAGFLAISTDDEFVREVSWLIG